MKSYPFSISECFGTLFDICNLDMTIEFSLQTFKSPMVCQSRGQIEKL